MFLIFILLLSHSLALFYSISIFLMIIEENINPWSWFAFFPMPNRQQTARCSETKYIGLIWKGVGTSGQWGLTAHSTTWHACYMKHPLQRAHHASLSLPLKADCREFTSYLFHSDCGRDIVRIPPMSVCAYSIRT